MLQSQASTSFSVVQVLFDIRDVKDFGHSTSDVFVYAPNFKTLMVRFHAMLDCRRCLQIHRST